MHEQIAGAFQNKNLYFQQANTSRVYLSKIIIIIRRRRRRRRRRTGFSIHLFSKFDMVHDGPVDME